MICFYQLPASLFDKDCIQVFGVVGGALVALFFICLWLAKQYRFNHLFTVGFGNGVGDITTTKTIPIGTPVIDVNIKFHAPIELHEINVRFTRDTKHRPPPNTSDVPRSIIEVLDIQDRERQPQSFRSKDDEAGGRDGYYNPPYRREKGGFVRLAVKVHAKEEWQGYLSFRTPDPDGNRQHDYRDVRIIRHHDATTPG